MSLILCLLFSYVLAESQQNCLNRDQINEMRDKIQQKFSDRIQEKGYGNYNSFTSSLASEIKNYDDGIDKLIDSAGKCSNIRHWTLIEVYHDHTPISKTYIISEYPTQKITSVSCDFNSSLLILNQLFIVEELLSQ